MPAYAPEIDVGLDHTFRPVTLCGELVNSRKRQKYFKHPRGGYLHGNGCERGGASCFECNFPDDCKWNSDK